MKACVVLLAVSISACGGGGGSEGKIDPATPESGQLLDREAKYGPSVTQGVTLLEPAVTPAKGLLIWIHGGGWFYGDRLSQEVLFGDLIAAGFAVLNAGYRLQQEGNYPRSVNDIETVLAALDQAGCADCSNPALWKQARRYADRGVQVAGSSAGGYLAVQAAGAYVSGNPQTLLRCVHALSAPVDLRPFSSFSQVARRFIGSYADGDTSPEKLAEMSPLFQLEQRRWKNVSQVRWAASAAYEDDLTPYQALLSFVKLLQNHGAKTRVNLIHGDREDGHAISNDLIRQLLATEARNCFAPEDPVNTGPPTPE